MSESNLTRSLARIRTQFPADMFLESPEDCQPYASDWTRTPGQADAVALPRSTDEVARLLALCRAAKVPVVPSGGRTGLAGGAVASPGELVLSLGRMNRIWPVDVNGRTVRVQAGAVTQAVHEHCAAVGLLWPIDLASKGTSQLGGNLATNAGGVRVIRYGMTRKWVAGLQAVTSSGEVLELNQQLEKNNSGYDLIQVLIGSEGTLAVTTEVTLKLTRLPGDVMVLLFAVAEVDAIQTLLAHARSGPFEIQAFEFFSAACLRAVEAKLGRRCRLSHSAPFYVLMEIEPGRASAEPVEEWLGKVLEEGVVLDGMLGHSTQESRELWGLREGITESIAMTAPVRKYDICVPVVKMVPFLAEARGLLNDPAYPFELFLFGHFGDGSPHLNLVKVPEASTAEFQAGCDRAEESLFALLKKFGGSISSEHGVGMLKKHWVEYSRTPEELRLYRALKDAFDPEWLLNPGKVIDRITPPKAL